MKECSICKKSIRRVKQLDNEYFCSVCLDTYTCQKCNQLYDGCTYCHKKLCGCIEYHIEYENTYDMYFCKSCFEEQDGETQLYKWFKEKYEEPLSLIEIQTIIKNNKNK